MGYFGKIKEKNLAIKLRNKGLSYNEILNYINVSKDTLSRWCKDIQLTENQKKRLLQNKKFGQKKGSMVAAENKKQKRISDTKKIHAEAKREIGNLNDREKFLIGIALYAGEGYKMDGKVGFTNADPNIISFMMDWYTKFVKIDKQRIRGAIWMHEELDEKLARAFWSKLTGIPEKHFHKTYVVKSKPSSKKIRKNIHQYGIFSIRFADANIHRRLMGWIYAILDVKITNTIRDSSMVEQEAVLAALDRNVGMKSG